MSTLGIADSSSLEGAAATVGAQSFALGQSRALATSLGRLAAGSFAERRRRAGDLLRRRARGRRRAVGRLLAALRRGWRQAVVRLLAALEAQRQAGATDQLGAIVQGAASAISSRALGAIALQRPEQTCRGADPLMLSRIFARWPTDGQVHMTPYKECISGRAKPFAAPTAALSRPMVILSKPMAILSRPAIILSTLVAILSRPMAILSRPMAVLLRPMAVLSRTALAGLQGQVRV